MAWKSALRTGVLGVYIHGGGIAWHGNHKWDWIGWDGMGMDGNRCIIRLDNGPFFPLGGVLEFECCLCVCLFLWDVM